MPAQAQRAQADADVPHPRPGGPRGCGKSGQRPRGKPRGPGSLPGLRRLLPDSGFFPVHRLPALRLWWAVGGAPLGFDLKPIPLEQAELHILRMIEAGEIFATIDQRNGMASAFAPPFSPPSLRLVVRSVTNAAAGVVRRGSAALRLGRDVGHHRRSDQGASSSAFVICTIPSQTSSALTHESA